MVTQLNVVSDKHAQNIVTPGSFESISYSPEQSVSQTKMGLAVKVSSVLQSTLDIETLVKLFSQQIKPAIPHDGFTYHNDPLGLAQHFGRKCKNQCQYRLLVNGEPLGELNLHRRWDFSAEEKKVFEYTLCGLVYPLRNAISYQQALLAAHKDPLTGVYNRATLEESLNREVKLAQRYVRNLSMIILDIDNFKQFNDNYGHDVGDEVIKTTVERTVACMRSTDVIFRYGGEEFVILLSNTDIEGAAFLAERIRESVEETSIHHESGAIGITISLGAAELKPNEMNANFFSRADKALYRAKGLGKNQVCIDNE
ncbi:MAG TPA: GGDEF domain-containing protein [Gammaproteobacteria bacterium]|nr:GGDEF domain-containing protein [Gammaproteobacteria bacterium]